MNGGASATDGGQRKEMANSERDNIHARMLSVLLTLVYTGCEG